MRLKIRTKIILSFFAPIIPLSVIVVIVSGYLLNNLYNEAQRLDDISKQRIMVTDLRLSLDRAVMPVNDYIITGDRKYADDFNAIYSEVEDRLKTVEDIAKTPQEMEILKDVKNSWQNIREISLKIFSIPEPAGNKDAARLMEEMDYRWAYPAIERLKRWREIDLKKYEIAFERHQSSWRQLWISIISEVILFLSISAIYMIFYSRTAARNEEAIYKSEELLKLQISRMPVGYIMWDTGFRVVSWNQAAERIFGFTSEDAKGKHPYDIIVPKEVQPHVDIIWSRLLEGDSTGHSINENLTKDGHTIVCEWTNTPPRYHNGEVIGILSMVQDITERKKMEGSLKEHIDELERFQKVAVKREFRIKELMDELKKAKGEGTTGRHGE